MTWLSWLYTTQDDLSSSRADHSELGSPTLIINQENTLQTWLQANQVVFSLLRFPLSMCQIKESKTN